MLALAYFCQHASFASPEHLTVQTSLPAAVSSESDDMMCAWSGGEIARMEWLFLGENTIVPMEFTNSSWNDAQFECITNYGKEPKLINLVVKGKVIK